MALPTSLTVLLLAAVVLSACDRQPAVVAAPVAAVPPIIVQGPAGMPGPAGPAGSAGATGATGTSGMSGDSTVIVVPQAASGAMK
jgi:hypothetical protein